MQFYNEGEPMDGEHYMKWNCENEDHPDWHIPYEYMTKKTITYTEKNIKKIKTPVEITPLTPYKYY